MKRLVVVCLDLEERLGMAAHGTYPVSYTHLGGLPSIILMDIVPVEYNTYWRTVIINNTDSRYYSYVKKDLAGRSISWYNEDDPDGQQNYVNMTYHWMAIG